jgi:hypothetical protein
MNTKTFFILLLLISSKLFSQNKFVVKTVYKTKAEITMSIKSADSVNKRKEFFEDEKYIVNSICYGEWGGAVIFKNKKTKTKYICESTCPVTLTKFNNRYFVSNTLHHLMTSAEVIEIVNPEKLQKATEEDEKRFNHEKVLQTGAKQIIRQLDNSILYSFVNDNKLYHIISGKKGTFIAKILNGKFIKLQTISDRNLWTYSPKNINTKDSAIATFNGYKEFGYIEIKGSAITLFIVK